MAEEELEIVTPDGLVDEPREPRNGEEQKEQPAAVGGDRRRRRGRGQSFDQERQAPARAGAHSKLAADAACDVDTPERARTGVRESRAAASSAPSWSAQPR